MKKYSGILGCFLLLLLISAVQASNTTTVSSTSTDAASQIYVSSYDLEPAVFYPYEKGTVTVHLANPTSTSLGLSGANLISQYINIEDLDSFNTMTTLGSGSTVDYAFVITMDTTDGTYYPLFTVTPDTWSLTAVHSRVKVVVDSKDLEATVSEKPDAFALNTKESVNLTVVNPRAGALDSITITPTGDGITVSPQEKYISSLDARSSVEVPFTITADKETNVTFHITYQNGDNVHTKDLVLPVNIGTDNTAALPIVNNMVLTNKGTYYDLTGDITNAGITNAKGLVVTVGSPATGTGTYPEYAIGSLAADDSGSFDLTFTTNDISSVPLVMHWKNSDGDNFEVTKVVNLKTVSGSTGGTSGSSITTGSNGSSASSSSGMPSGGPGGDMSGGPGGSRGSSSILGITSKGGGLSSFYPVIAFGVIAIISIVAYVKRKWILAKFKKQ